MTYHIAQGALLNVTYLDGTGVWGRMDTCVCVAESLHCSPETITALLIGYCCCSVAKLCLLPWHKISFLKMGAGKQWNDIVKVLKGSMNYRPRILHSAKLPFKRAFLVGQLVRNLPAMQETRI